MVNGQEQMWNDPIVEETRRLRDEYAAKHGYDIHAIVTDLQEWERQGYPLVIPSPKTIQSSDLPSSNLDMNENLSFRITSFFDFWRDRTLFIHNLDHQNHNYEANILIWSCLDALSNLWAKEIGKNKCKNFSESKRQIFDEFLSYYYPDVFNQVSLPHIWHRIDEEDVFLGRGKSAFKLPDDVAKFFQDLCRKNQPIELEIGSRKLRNISDDLPIDIILSKPNFKYNAEELAKIKRWLKFSRYGAIAYKEMRNYYIHEGRPGKGSHGFELHESELRPTYLSHVYTTPPQMGFSAKFMLKVLSICIASFEKDAIDLQQDPAPN